MRIIRKLLFSAAFVALLSCVATAQEATAQSENEFTPTSLRRALIRIGGKPSFKTPEYRISQLIVS
jgi:hypothetical protein